jgi:hypothetical protein
MALAHITSASPATALVELQTMQKRHAM